MSQCITPDESTPVTLLLDDAVAWIQKVAAEIKEELTYLLNNTENMSLVESVDRQHRAVSRFCAMEALHAAAKRVIASLPDDDRA